MISQTTMTKRNRDFIDFTKDPTGTALNLVNPSMASNLLKKLTFAQSLRNNPELQSIDMHTFQVIKTISASANHLMKQRSLQTGEKAVLQEFKESGEVILSGKNGQKMYFDNCGCGFVGQGISQQSFRLRDNPLDKFQNDVLSVNLYPMPIQNVEVETVKSSTMNGLSYNIYNSPLLITQVRKRIYEKNETYLIDSYYDKIGNWLATKFTSEEKNQTKGKYRHYLIISAETYNYQYEKHWNIYNFAQKQLSPFNSTNEYSYYIGTLNNNQDYIFDVPNLKVLPNGKFVSSTKKGFEINKQDFEQLFGIFNELSKEK